MADPRHQLGHRAEDAVAAWLTSRGWRVLERRWRAPSGELDLVCLDPQRRLVGVEVKLRRTGRAGSGAEALDRRRVARLRAALAEYATRSRTGCTGLRIDLVSVVPAAGVWRLSRLAAVDAW
jgi:putative endonuclease